MNVESEWGAAHGMFRACTMERTLALLGAFSTHAVIAAHGAG